MITPVLASACSKGAKDTVSSAARQRYEFTPIVVRRLGAICDGRSRFLAQPETPRARMTAKAAVVERRAIKSSLQIHVSIERIGVIEAGRAAARDRKSVV